MRTRISWICPKCYDATDAPQLSTTGTRSPTQQRSPPVLLEPSTDPSMAPPCSSSQSPKKKIVSSRLTCNLLRKSCHRKEACSGLSTRDARENAKKKKDFLCPKCLSSDTLLLTHSVLLVTSKKKTRDKTQAHKTTPSYCPMECRESEPEDDGITMFSSRVQNRMRAWGWKKRNARRIYITMHRSIRDYAAAGWQPRLSPTQFAKLEKAQNTCLRAITDQYANT